MLQPKSSGWYGAIWETLTGNPGQWMTPQEVWEYIDSYGLFHTQGKTPWLTAGTMLRRLYENNIWGEGTLQRLSRPYRYRINPAYNSSDLEWLDEEENAVIEPDINDVNEYDIVDILSDGCFLGEDILQSMLHRLRAKQNIILQGPPGTGKTWLAKRLAYALIGQRDDGKVRPFQFHPNMSYEDFVRGWRPSGDGRLELVDGPFLRLAEDARQDADGKYVMVIEEINRGNPASIFGELLTLLEV